MSKRVCVVETMTSAEQVYAHNEAQNCHSRAIKISKEYPLEVFCVENQPGWMITEYERKRMRESREYYINGVNLGNTFPAERPQRYRVTVLRLTNDSKGYPKWQTQSSAGGQSLVLAINYCRKQEQPHIIKIQYPGGKVEVRYYLYKKPSTLAVVKAYKARVKENADKINGSWYPIDYYSLDIPNLDQFNRYGGLKGLDAPKFWAKQRLILRDIDIHLQHAQLSEVDRTQLQMYRATLKQFIEALDK